jgi:hypothetical protein
MVRNLNRVMAWQLLVLSLILGARPVAGAGGDFDSRAFVSPPPSARPWVYWFPLDGNLSREGITADLEAMQRVGIGGVLYMETDQSTPRGPAAFGGPLWRELIQHACREAQRLGLEINMNNDAGWCGSGGPWITPELSMQRLTVSETYVVGPRRFEGVLSRPAAVKDFYRDIVVQAFPMPWGDDVGLGGAQVQVSASAPAWKGDPRKPFDGTLRPAAVFDLPGGKQPEYVQLAFVKPYTAHTLTLTMPMGGHFVHGDLQISDDGRRFKTVGRFAGQPPLISLSVAETTARYFRITFTAADRQVKKLVLARLTLSPGVRIENIQGKASFTVQQFPPHAGVFPTLPAASVIARDKIVDISARMDAAGKLAWDVPPGKWTILRIGHTTTGKDNHPAPEAGRGLECDKLSPAGIEAHFAGLMAKLVADNGPLVGKTLVTTHIDSWEVGSQNWTPRMREEFRRLRGYDMFSLLPVVTGRVVDSVEVSERFLWDLRQTVSDLLVENYAGRMHALAKAHGLRLSIEAYGEPADDIRYAAECDEPMGEFWSWAKYGAANSCTEMTSAGHVYGKRIVGAEAFTATNDEKWLGHPASIKDLGDWAFCEGINRFVFHRYALQPWKDVRPGVSMGPWGLHYERTQTWWEQSRAWHQYLARCQYMLRQGLFVADICDLQPEGAPRGFSPPGRRGGDPLLRPGYNFDGCTADVVLTRMRVENGRLVLPDGMSYRVLALPDVETMTPALLAKVQELASAGATIIGGKRPRKSPSLTGYPQCDGEVRRRADALWRVGKLVSNQTAEEWLAAQGVPPDFSATAPLRYTHRATSDADNYFVANPEAYEVAVTASFRVTGKQPELWSPDSGEVEPAAAFEVKEHATSLPLRFGPSGSVFVVFRKSAARVDSVVSLARDGQPLLPPSQRKAKIVIGKARYGLLDDPRRTRDVRAKLQAIVDGGASRVIVARMAEGDDPAPMIVKTLEVDYTADGRALQAAGHDPEAVHFAVEEPAGAEVARVRFDRSGRTVVEAWQAGGYELKTASGRTLRGAVAALPPAVEVAGPWDVTFPGQAVVQQKQSPPPRQLRFDKLISWSEHPDADVKYYSGTATYRTSFAVSGEMLGHGRRVVLDLGRVAVMAEVCLNGHNLGIRWKPPYQADVTGAVRPGQNALEVRVVNLWINRLIGDEELPDDSPRANGMTLKEWPQWLLEGKPSPTGRHTFTSHRLWKRGDPLQESGLIGPVLLRAGEQVVVK